MSKKYIVLIFTLIVSVMSQLALAQGSNFRRKTPALGTVKIIAGGGLSYYLGDLRDEINANHIHSQAALGISYRLTERLVARGELRFYRISGSQEGTRIWYNNLSFRSDNPDGYVGLQLELFKFSEQPRINPYFFVGIGLTHINPKTSYQGVWYSLPPLQTEGVAYARTVRILPVGVGVSWRCGERWNLGIELSNNYAGSDYLDDVSTNYPNTVGMSEIARLLSDRRGELTPPIALNEPGNIRGNPRVKDAYGFLSLRAEYLLGTRANRLEKRRLRCYY